MTKLMKKSIRAISMLEAAVVMVITAGVITAGFSLVTSLATGDQAIQTAVGTTEAQVKSEMHQDLKSAVQCSPSSPLVSVEPGGSGVQMITVDSSRDFEAIVWRYDTSTLSLVRETYNASPATCSRTGSPESAYAVADNVTAATFTSDGVNASIQAQIGLSGTSQLLEVTASS